MPTAEGSAYDAPNATKSPGAITNAGIVESAAHKSRRLREGYLTVAEARSARVAEEKLGKDLEDYPGQWVAVQEHDVVAHAASLGELREQIKKQSGKGKPSVFKVSKHPDQICFF